MRHLIATIAVLLALNLAPMQAHAGNEQEIFLGSVAMDVPAEMIRRLKPLTDYLSHKTGLHISFRASPNLGSAVNELGKDFTQIAYLTPVAYIEAHEKYNVQPLVAPLTQGKSSFNLIVAVRNDSPVKTMKDLKGKKFAFGDPKALLQRAVVVGGGIRIEELSSHAFLNHYDNIAKAVLNQDFDAGILKDTIYNEFAPKGLRKIYTSPPLPSYVFAVSPKLPAAIVKKLREAFLEIKPDTAEHKAILNELDKGYDGFEPSEDKDYDEIRQLIAPFAAVSK